MCLLKRHYANYTLDYCPEEERAHQVPYEEWLWSESGYVHYIAWEKPCKNRPYQEVNKGEAKQHHLWFHHFFLHVHHLRFFLF